jgi:cytochrome c biogenesis protein CcmG/thiol:disulfide interchange protein DsbE
MKLRWQATGRYLSFGFVGAVVLSLVSLLGWAVFQLGTASDQEIGRYPVNVRPAPDFEVELYDGNTFRMADQRGKWVMVHFWASWCPSCRDEAPVMQQAWLRWKDRGIIFLGIDYQDTPEDGMAFIREFGITYPNGPEPKGLSVDFGILGVPESFIVDPEGRIVGRYVGPMEGATTDEMIGEFLLE